MAKRPRTLPSRAYLEPRVRAARLSALGSYLCLVALLGLYYLAIADLHGARPGVILLVELVPLAILAPGMLRGSARGHAWMCFVVNLYFIKGVLAAFAPSRQLFGLLEMLVSIVLFFSALLYVRWRGLLRQRLSLTP